MLILLRGKVLVGINVNIIKDIPRTEKKMLCYKFPVIMLILLRTRMLVRINVNIIKDIPRTEMKMLCYK